MPYVKYLVPLTGYEESSVSDINDDGVCVGTSYDRSPLGWLAGSRATLWSGDTPIPLLKKPAQKPQAGISPASHALRIDKSGRVLCKTDTSPPTYFLWLSETEPAIDLSETVEYLEDAIDLNNNGVLLFTSTGGAALAVQDAAGGTQTALPSNPVSSALYDRMPIGIDDDGRVVVYWWEKTSSFGDAKARVFYWSPSDPAEWHELPTPTHLAFQPFLAKRGYVMATSFDDGRAYYYDLKKGDPSGVQIPAAQDVPSYFSLYTDVTSDDCFVGGEGPAGDYSPTLYKKSENKVTLLEYAYPKTDWHPSFAVGANNLRIVGDSDTGAGGHRRAWKLVLNTLGGPYDFFDPIDWQQYRGIDPLASLLGATSRWYILLTKPDPAPLELLRQLVKSLKPEERKLVLGQVQHIQGNFAALEKLLREDGLGS